MALRCFSALYKEGTSSQVVVTTYGAALQLYLKIFIWCHALRHDVQVS